MKENWIEVHGNPIGDAAKKRNVTTMTVQVTVDDTPPT
jgi:hypothetical protein